MSRLDDTFENFIHPDHLIPTVMAIELAKVILTLLINDYKEVDFECYMTQASLASNGETNYHNLHSKNGDIFYGAIHTFIHLFI